MTCTIFSDKGGIRCEQVAVAAGCAEREDGLESGVVPSHQSKTQARGLKPRRRVHAFGRWSLLRLVFQTSARSDGPDNGARAERLLETKTGLWGIYWDTLLWI